MCQFNFSQRWSEAKERRRLINRFDKSYSENVDPH